MSGILTSQPPRVIPVTYEIRQKFYCRQCVESCPAFMKLREWVELEIGPTRYGWQVWCRRHQCNVIHIDFCGQTLPANIATGVQ